VCVLLALAIAAYAAKTTVAKYTVTATISNTDGAGNPYTFQSDGKGAYQNGPGITSDLTPDSSGAGTLYDQWNLSFGSASSRSVNLTLQPIGTAPTIFNGSQSFPATVYSRCFSDGTATTDQNWTLITLSSYPQGDTNCAMRILFTYAGIGYTLVMSPAQAASGEPATGTATVTCTSGASPCSSWTDVPTPGLVDGNGNPLSNVANLYSGSTFVGQYSLSFNVTLTHP
jgi:hypothetical protein